MATEPDRREDDSISNDGNQSDSHDNSSSRERGQEKLIIEANGVTYECMSRSGKGSFGVVYKAITRGNGQIVAIKRVLQDPRYKNRELQIMKMIRHPNTVNLINSFYERSKGEVYLNLVLAYVPKNLYEVCVSFTKRKEKMPMDHIRLYTYQLCRSLSYVHALGICHRDIKPQNLLIDPETHLLKLCDFGSAKLLVKGEPNVSYICSRYYRAPELIFGASDYTPAIDVWSSGCVMAEMILGEPIFAGESGIDQLVEIIKGPVSWTNVASEFNFSSIVLGTPSREEIRAMNRDYQDYKQFPSIKPHPWSKVFPPLTLQLALDVLAKMLVYTPTLRYRPLEVCAHPFFNELRRLHENRGQPWPGHTLNLFDYSTEEIQVAQKIGVLERLLPQGELLRIAQMSPPNVSMADAPSLSNRSADESSD